MQSPPVRASIRLIDGCDVGARSCAKKLLIASGSTGISGTRRGVKSERAQRERALDGPWPVLDHGTYLQMKSQEMLYNEPETMMLTDLSVVERHPELYVGPPCSTVGISSLGGW